MEFRLYPFKQWYSVPFLSVIGIPSQTFQSLEFQPYPFNYWNSGTILSVIGIPALFFQLLEFWPYSFIIGIPALSLQLLEFWPYSFIIGILFLSFESLEFWPYPFHYWNSGPILLIIGIPALFFLNTGIMALHWISGLIFINITIMTHFFKYWISFPMFQTSEFLAYFYNTSEFWPFRFKYKNLGPILLNIGILSHSSNIWILALFL